VPSTADPEVDKSFTLDELAVHVGGKLRGDAGLRIHGVAALEDAGSDQISFVSHQRYAAEAAKSGAGALLVNASYQELDRPAIICDNPYLAFARVAQLFMEPPWLPLGVHPRAFVAESAQLADGVCVGPLAHIGMGVRVGQGTRIYGGSYLGRNVRVGEQCLIYPHVAILDRCRVGSRVIIHSGTVVGSDGYGFAQDENGRHIKIPQLGIVEIDDDVEIGANCTIDRATLGRTWIRQGTKIDNLVHVAHNVEVGEHNLLVAQVGIAGSTRLGSHVVLAGQVGVGGHITIGDRVRVGAKSALSHSVSHGQDVLGLPAVSKKEWMRTYAAILRLPQMRDELKELKNRVSQLQQALQGTDND
jgi:UDP-3-O-[3-hydroxymyristoyl] glucosamine N-acyltransferase